ncbi:hypothetical protein F0562_004370 [Nyssa sinensis]|uniref:Uncharacterized protein n=1 Tax=Nyssa sinensis TaxID=561372 RepID=A0A5J5C308_9ASTE|nr:hypothetical protein F0562_004370 [Nyssa sinensis]
METLCSSSWPPFNTTNSIACHKAEVILPYQPNGVEIFKTGAREEGRPEFTPYPTPTDQLSLQKFLHT